MKKCIKSTAIFFLISISLILMGCANISRQEAESTAINFVKANVKFFATEQEDKVGLPNYDILIINTIEENKNWAVLLQIKAPFANDSKSNELVVKVNKKGDVVEFNGKKLQ